MRKKIGAFGFILILNSSVSLANEILLDRIAAVVDSEPILWSEIKDKIEHGPLVKFSDFPAVEHADEKTRALNDSINARIIMRKAEELDIQVKDDQVENQISQILSEGKFTRESLKDYLAKQNKDLDQYKKDIHDQMVFMRFKGRVILPSIKISDHDLEVYFLKKQGTNLEAGQISLKKIVIPVESSLFANEKEKLAQEVYDKLKGGLSFEEAQAVYSSAEKDRPPQDVQIRDLDGSLRKNLKDLKVGEFTHPLRLNNSWVLFYVSDKRLIGSKAFEQYKPQLENELRAIEVVRQTNFWLQNERERSKITILKD